jgi:hypothetical protein
MTRTTRNLEDLAGDAASAPITLSPIERTLVLIKTNPGLWRKLPKLARISRRICWQERKQPKEREMVTKEERDFYLS